MIQQLLRRLNNESVCDNSFARETNQTDSYKDAPEEFTLQERIDNSHLRYVDEKEKSLSSNISTLIIRECGVTVCVNAATTYFINLGLESLTFSFNLPLAIFSMIGVNGVINLYLLGCPKLKGYFLPLALSRLILSAGVNGQKLSQINEAYNMSRDNIVKLQTEITKFEQGYKSQPPQTNDAFTIISVVCVLLVVIKLLSIKRGNNG